MDPPIVELLFTTAARAPGAYCALVLWVDQRRDVPERALRRWTRSTSNSCPESDHSFAGQIGYDCSSTIVGSDGAMLPETETRSRALAPSAAWRPLPSSWVLPITGRQGGSRPSASTGDVIGGLATNSILTATLLLSPRRHWWLYLLAAFPAHLAASCRRLSHSLVLALFVTNCSEALLAAVCVRWFTDAPARLDTLRRMVAFIVGRCHRPFGSSFLDARPSTCSTGSPTGSSGVPLLLHVLTELTVCRRSSPLGSAPRSGF